MLYAVFYYETYEDVNSWKSEPKSIIIKAKDIAQAKIKFKLCYPKYLLLSTIPKQKEIRSMINPNKLRDFEAMLGICGPEYLFDIAHEQVSDYCLAKLESNNETAYIYNITIGSGIDKEYFCTATVTKPQKKAGWYICEYTDVNDDGYNELGTHLFIPVIKPVKYIEDNLVCDDKSPLLIFLCICMHDFGYGHVTSFEGSPLENVNVDILIRACARFDSKTIRGYNLSTLTSAGRWRILNLFLNNEITVDMISTWIDPYNIERR